MSEENEIKVGDLITCYDCPVGLVYKVEAPWKDSSKDVVCYIDQRTGVKDWNRRYILIKLNKPTEEKS